VERDAGSKFLDEESGLENQNDKKKNQNEEDYFDQHTFEKTWWNQNLLLIVEILHIYTSVNNYKNGKRATDKNVTLL